jgi:hypothetical protein
MPYIDLSALRWFSDNQFKASSQALSDAIFPLVRRRKKSCILDGLLDPQRKCHQHGPTQMRSYNHQ